MVAVARLLCTGHVTRYRNAKFFAPIGAAGLPFVLGRLKRNHEITPGIADPAEGLALIYTDTIVHDPRVLRFVVEMMGADRVMMGSDMPFPIGEHEPMKIVAAAGLKPEQAASINGGLAQKLFESDERMRNWGTNRWPSGRPRDSARDNGRKANDIEAS